MPKKRKSRFQIEDIGIIIPNSQNKIGRHHFQIEDIVKQPMGKRKRPFQIEDIHYTNPKFSEQDCATNHFLIEDIRLDDPPSLCFWCWSKWFLNRRY